MRVAVLMDPLTTLMQPKDTTLALISSAQQRGHDVRCFTKQDWYVVPKGKCLANTISLTCTDVKKWQWVDNQDAREETLDTYDAILMRQDPPVDSDYIYATQVLTLLESKQVLISNRPQSVRDVNEKLGILAFPQVIPETLVTSNIQRLHQFWLAQREVILKPLHGMGGESIFRLNKQGENLNVILSLLTAKGTKAVMAQRFIPDILEQGDKRILMIHGEPIPYALARMPTAGDFRGNLAAGATGKVVPLSKHDEQICKTVSPFLKNKGLHFVGLDVIGEYLTEINVTSPTCLREISAETGIDIAAMYWQGIERLTKQGSEPN